MRLSSVSHWDGFSGYAFIANITINDNELSASLNKLLSFEINGTQVRNDYKQLLLNERFSFNYYLCNGISFEN